MPAVKGEPHRLCGAKTIAKDAGQLSATDNQHGSVLNLEISKTVKGASSSRVQIPAPPLDHARCPREQVTRGHARWMLGPLVADQSACHNDYERMWVRRRIDEPL